MSINRKASGITERVAAYINFDQTATGGVIGNPTPALEDVGYGYPSVQAAIDDLWFKALLPVGSVVTTPVNRDPRELPAAMTSQRDSLTITGTPLADGQIEIALTKVDILATDTTDEICSKIVAVLSLQPFISSSSSSANTVTYEYTDTNVHPLAEKSQNGLVISSFVEDYAGTTGYYGYGSWEYLGTENKFMKDLYYWLRIA